MSAEVGENAIDVALKVATALTAVGGEYFLGGSLAEPFDDSEFARRCPVVVSASGESIVVKSAEDTVLRKLLWFREGGGVSEKQWRDVVSVLRISGDAMDDAYLNSWATRLEIGGLLQAARDARSPELPSR